MIWDQGAFWILSSIAFETVKSQREEKQKRMISGKSFSFLNFWNISECGNKSWHQLRRMFLISYQYFWSSTSVLLKFRHTIKQIWSNLAMTQHQTYCLTFIYNCMEFYCPNGRESWVIETCKSPSSRGKNMVFFGKRFELIKINSSEFKTFYLSSMWFWLLLLQNEFTETLAEKV